MDSSGMCREMNAVGLRDPEYRTVEFVDLSLF